MVVLGLLSVGCGICKEDLLQSVESPGTSRTATLVRLNCSAISRFGYQVRVTKGHGLFATDETLLSVKDTTAWRGPGQEEAARHAEIARIDVHWVSTDSLAISLDPRAKAFYWPAEAGSPILVVTTRDTIQRSKP